MIYVVSDIHGCFQTFQKALKSINFRKNDSMYILGDVIDRGNEGIKTLKFIKSQKNMFLLKGNHEFMMEESLDKKDSYIMRIWGSNGGGKTFQDFIALPVE